MKRLVSIVSLSIFALTTAYAQSDDAYYSNNDTYAYNNSDNGYNNNYDNSYQNYNSGYQAFYDQMSPYGEWVNNPRYGYVWVPTSVAGNFSPYLTGGHWAYTDYGWTWVSDYEWGWAAFHYGRWFQDDVYGWMWMPGSEWAPAWVMWGSYTNNYCWAPIAPGYGFSSYYRPEARCWNFVGCDHIAEPYLVNHVVNHNVFVSNNTTYITNNITIINNGNSYNNTRFFAGPKVHDVERATGHTISSMSIASVSRPAAAGVNGNQLQVYRPAISRQVMQNNNTIHQNGLNINRSNFSNMNNNTVQIAQQQRSFDQSQMQRTNDRTISQPMRENVQQQRTFAQPERQQQFSQPMRETVQQQRTFAQPARQQQFSQPVLRQQERNFASVERPVQQQFSRQSAEVSRASFSPQAGRGGRFR